MTGLPSLRALGTTAALVGALTAALPAPAAEWRADPANSRLTFAGTQGGRPFEGAFQRFSVDIRFDANDLPASKVVVVIQTASINTGDAVRDEAARSADWFAASRFPEARFETISLRHLGGERYEADAVLQLRDVSKPVLLPFTLRRENGATRAVGMLTINRTDFGIGQGQWASPQVVAHEVTIRFELLASPATP